MSQNYYARLASRANAIGTMAPALASFTYASDQSDNAAIQAGDVRAFNIRVEYLKGSPLNYDHEKATNTVIRLRDEHHD